MTFQVAGRVPLPMAQRPQASLTVASLDFFRTMGIPLRCFGRLFDVAEQEPDDVVVNEAFARQIFPGEDPLGRRIESAAMTPIAGPSWAWWATFAAASWARSRNRARIALGQHEDCSSFR